MEPDETPFVLPRDVPPPLQNAEESLYRVIGNASRVRRNTQKILHLIARCINIIEDLKSSISSPPSAFEEMIANIESVRKFEILLVKFEGAVTREALLPASLDHEMMKTWESSRKEFYELLREAYDPEFKPSNTWEKGVEQVSRLDDSLWVSLIAQDMRGRGIAGAERAESTAASLLEGDQAPSNSTADIETVMRAWKGEDLSNVRRYLETSSSSVATPISSSTLTAPSTVSLASREHRSISQPQGQMFAVPPSSQPGAVGGSNPRYQMMLHNMQMLGRVYYMESAVADGPRHRETWTASVYLLNGPNGAVINTFTARAATRQAAREAASRHALIALGVIPEY